MIETKRLTFRKFIQSDLDDLYEYFSDPEVGESAGWAHHESKDQTQIVLDKFINDDERFAIVYQCTQKVIGHISFKESIDENKRSCRELGYAINKSFWNKGYMTESIQKITEVLFESDIDLQYIFAECRKDSASERVLNKCDFVFVREGVFVAKTLPKCCPAN